MPLNKKKKEVPKMESSDVRNIEKSLSSPDISSPEGSSENNTKETALKRSESQSIRKRSWFKRLIKPFRRFKRNSTGCFPKESKSKSEFHTSLSSEILFDNLKNGSESEKSLVEDVKYDEVDAGKIKRKDVKRKSSKKPAPSIPFNANLINELKDTLDQNRPSASNKSSPTTTPDYPIYGNEADLRHMASKRRRQSINQDLEKRLPDLETMYVDTWNMANNNENSRSTCTQSETSITSTTVNQNQVDELDFVTHSEPQPIETLFSKFPKPKLPKRKPSRRGSRPEEFLKEAVATLEIDQGNRKESITNRRSNAELDELIQKLTEIQPPNIEEQPKLPPTPKRRTIFDSLPNITFDEEINSIYSIPDENKTNISINEPIYMTIEDDISIGDDLMEKSNQLIKEFTDDKHFIDDTLKPPIKQKPYILLTRNNSYPKSKTKPLVCKTSVPILITNNNASNHNENQQNNKSQINSENGKAAYFKRSYTLPTKHEWTMEATSKSTSTKFLTVKREVRSTSESSEYVESESTILTQDSFTQTSMSNLLSTNIESILEPDLKNFESEFQELLIGASINKNKAQITPPNTPEQTETTEGNLNSDTIKDYHSEFQSEAEKLDNHGKTISGTTVMTKLAESTINDKSSADIVVSIHNSSNMSSNFNKASYSNEVLLTSLLETNTRKMEHQDISTISKIAEKSKELTKTEVNGSEVLSKSPLVCLQDLSLKPNSERKPPITPKPLNILNRKDDFVRRGAVRRKSNSTSDDHSTSPTQSQLSKLSKSTVDFHVVDLKHAQEIKCDNEPNGSS